MNVRPFCIALLGLSLAAAKPAAALDARDLMGGWYASGLTATTAEQDPTILELFLTVNLDGTIDVTNASTGDDDLSYAFSYGRCFQPRAATSNSTEANDDDPDDAQTALQILITGGKLEVSPTGSVNGTIQLDSNAGSFLGYDTIVIDDFRMNSTAELITGVTSLTGERVMHLNMVRLPVDEDIINVPCLFDDCDVTPAPTATLSSVNVAVGDSVAQGDSLATVVGDQTETLTAPADGLVVSVNFEAGASVEFEQQVMLIESPATTVSVVKEGQPQSQFAEGSWRIVGYFETIQDGGQDFPYTVPTPATGPASWTIESLGIGIDSPVKQGDTVGRLVSSVGGEQLDVLAESDGIVTEVYRNVSEIAFPDLGGEDALKVSGAGTFPGNDYKILCLGPTFFDTDFCANVDTDPLATPRQHQLGDYITPGTVVATIQLTCCPNSGRVPVYANGSGVITEIDVTPCFGTFGGAGPAPSCTEATVLGSPLMTTTATGGTVTDLNVSTGQWVNEGDPVATVQSDAGNLPPVEVYSPANGTISEIFVEQWSQDVAWDSPFMTLQNSSSLGEVVDAGETLFVINEDPTCHPNYSSNYGIQAAGMGLCESATITSIGVTDGQALCSGAGGLVAYEYSCPDPDDPTGPPITGGKSDFTTPDDGVVNSINVGIGTVVRPGDILISFRRGFDTDTGSIDGSVRVYAANGAAPGGLTSPHIGQLQTSSVEFSGGCDLQMARNAQSSAARVSRQLKGEPTGEFSFFPDPGGDWYFQISKDRNFAIGNSVGFYLGGNFRHQNMIMVKGPTDAIHVPSLGLGDPAVTLTSLHGLTATDYLAYPPTPGSSVVAGDPIATLEYTAPSGSAVVEVLVSPVDGYVGEIYYAEGTSGIAYDQSLMTLRSSPAFPTPSNQPAETSWEIRGFTDRNGPLAGATRTGTLAVNENGDELSGGSLESSDGSPSQTVTGGAVELAIPPLDPIDPEPETTDGSLRFGTSSDPMTFAGSSTEEEENLMLSFQRDVIAGVIEDSTGTTGFVVGMVPEPSARLLALAALGALGMLRGRLRRQR